MNMGIGYPSSWAKDKVSDRTSLEESPSMSKAVRRGGAQGSKYDFPNSSTGRNHIERAARDPDPLPASLPARTRGHIGEARVEQVGHTTDGRGGWNSATHDHELIGNAIATHPRLEPQGLSKVASGIGKASKVPAGRNEAYRGIGDSGALAGDSHPRPSYTGGKGPIKP
jgi:hypothetical protein